MSEEKDTKKIIEDLKASVFKRIDSIKENEKQISSSDTFEISDAEDHTPKQKDKSYKQKITKIYGPPGTGKTTKLINLVKDFIAKGVEIIEYRKYKYHTLVSCYFKNSWESE